MAGRESTECCSFGGEQTALRTGKGRRKRSVQNRERGPDGVSTQSDVMPAGTEKKALNLRAEGKAAELSGCFGMTAFGKLRLLTGVESGRPGGGVGAGI